MFKILLFSILGKHVCRRLFKRRRQRAAWILKDSTLGRQGVLAAPLVEGNEQAVLGFKSVEHHI
ncbi:hypothetical protein CLOSTMETH_03682 [[Clostridium] methylpentosum DSM 5476]|uniref:Uncharacterized protein n=1 Tax=[Clostridium] methylpentosum DSM 5476 TaxID=537013 RepID=C0EII6_9FIRM|nr:hypothetical protein CLOSTMETH_03682 [[Clostridium] methylpentosum DSM 5476]